MKYHITVKIEGSRKTEFVSGEDINEVLKRVVDIQLKNDHFYYW